MKKIILIGAGAVGSSFIYSALNKDLANTYKIIDLNEDMVLGHSMDFEDGSPISKKPYTISAGSYADAEDADLIVITAGRPQKPGETRLQMVADNAKIMRLIATNIKNNNFKGITLIASNPVDIMTGVYQKITGFDPKRVISSGTLLDTSRFKVELSKLLDVETNEIEAYLLGEHGDSSVATIEYGKIKGIPLIEYAKNKNVSLEQLNEAAKKAAGKAYEIIEKKGATYYGIGMTLAIISEAILNDNKLKAPISKLLTGEYGCNGCYAGILSTVGKNGIESSEEFPLSESEMKKFEESIKILNEIQKAAFEAIK